MSAEYQAVNLRAPHDINAPAANNFRVLKFTADVTHKANALPNVNSNTNSSNEWAGKFVRMIVVGGNLHFAFSKSSSAEVSTAVAASDAGASALVGDYLPDGQELHVRLPFIKEDELLYFVREASAACTVYMRLASD